MSTICIFSDSTAWGAWDLEKGGWVNRLWLKYGGSNYKHEIYNLSISGGTTETILARFESEAKVRGADVLIFQTGGNDVGATERGGNPQIPLEVFKKKLYEIIARAKKLAPKIIFLDSENCDERNLC